MSAFGQKRTFLPRMFWFKKTPPFEDSQLGRFEHTAGSWFPAPHADGIGVVLRGGKTGPSEQVVQVARQLLGQPAEVIALAETYLRSDQQANEFMQGNGQLVCDGFTVYESGEFAVEFSLTEWPDAMISVPFKDSRPVEVQLGD